ncbi:hypothetical protein H5J24_21500 [Chryseobacterium capnotolerans]|nr:DUF5977 domain-containing protein [Chryseobacterium capnotolerans]UHO38114.1 hypothetical protein H5J24_21500 [Chryseobacterium capnotolerans]
MFAAIELDLPGTDYVNFTQKTFGGVIMPVTSANDIKPANTDFTVDHPYCAPNDPTYPAPLDLRARYEKNKKKPVSWYLSKIENRFGEVISFDYETKKSLTFNRASGSYYPYPANSWSTSKITLETKRKLNMVPIIKSIQSSSSKITFNYGDVRKDIYDAGRSSTLQKLNEIVVSSINKTNNTETVVNKARLVQVDIESTEKSIHADPAIDKAVYTRMFLTEIALSDKNGVPVNKYNFKYKTPRNLPNKQSFQIDHWGFYKAGDPKRFIPNLFYYPTDNKINIDISPFSLYKRDQFTGTELQTAGTSYTKDSTPKLEDAVSGSLESISSLGGKVLYTYDLNYFTYYNQKREGPGLRVKESTTDSGNGQFTEEYTYGANGDGTGTLLDVPKISGVTWGGQSEYAEPEKYVSASGDHEYSFYYGSVKKTRKKDNTTLGYTINEYSTFTPIYTKQIDIDDFHYKSPMIYDSYATRTTNIDTVNGGIIYIGLDNRYYYYIPEADFKGINGKLKSSKVYNSGNQIVKSVLHDYKLKWKETDLIDDGWYGGGLGKFYSFNYDLSKTETTEYFGNGSISSSVNYVRNNERKIKDIFKTIGGANEEEHIKYAYEGNDSNALTIKNENRLNEISEHTLIDQGKTTYTKNVLNQFSVPFSVPTGGFVNKPLIEKAYSQKSFDGVDYRKGIQTLRQGIYGNVIESINEQEVYTTTIWGYNHTQPIAKIEGASYAQVMQAFGLDGNDNKAYLQLEIVKKSDVDVDENSENTLALELNTFKNKPELKDFQITTYTYDPLIGAKKITPPSGVSEQYKYDDAGRLEKVLNADNNIVKEYKYNVTPTYYYSDEASKTFTSVCGPGTLPSPVTYVVPAAKYVSTVSQVEADQMAQNDINANGLNYATTNGICTPYVCTITPTHLADIYYSSFQETAFGHIKVILSFPMTGYNGSTPNWSNGVFIGTLDSLCRPTSYKNFNVSSNGGGWSVSLGPAGDITVRSTGGNSGSSATLYFEYDK